VGQTECKEKESRKGGYTKKEILHKKREKRGTQEEKPQNVEPYDKEGGLSNKRGISETEIRVTLEEQNPKKSSWEGKYY